MQLHTSRLTLQLLTLEQAELYFIGNNLLEENLGLPKANRIIDEHFKGVAETIFLPNLRKDSTNITFYSFFILIENTSKNIVGEIGCHSKPDISGEVEIGYSTQKAHQRKGFMNEALGGFAQFLLALNNVTTIIAETDKINIPSQRILVNNNFIIEKETEESIRWKLNLVK